MTKLRVHSFSISVDGYGAGPNQDFANPLGVGGIALHQWFFATRTFQMMSGRDGGATGIDDDFCGTRVRQYRSVDSGSEHVWADSGTLAR
jgi:hypothetical protein